MTLCSALLYGSRQSATTDDDAASQASAAAPVGANCCARAVFVSDEISLPLMPELGDIDWALLTLAEFTSRYAHLIDPRPV